MDEDARLHPAGTWPVTTMPEAAPGSSSLLRALPAGWEMLGRCRIGAAGPANYPTGCFALAHPTTGIALVDVAPDATPNAESRLRRALGAMNFWSAFPGYLPVWHGRIELSAWRALPGIMAEGFSELPSLTVPGRTAWIAAARAALAEETAWDVPGAVPRRDRSILPADLPMDLEMSAERLPRRSGRGMTVALGFAATFAFGLASGIVLLSDGRQPALAPDAGAVPAMASMPGASAPPAAQDRLTTTATAALPEPAPAAPQQVEPSPLPLLPAVAGPEAAPPAAERPSAELAGPEPSGPAEATETDLPLPPAAPKAPAQRVASKPPAERIDRDCRQALYRYQQGMALTATETAYLRDGCATRR